jgi:hypothetical protein
MPNLSTRDNQMEQQPSSLSSLTGQSASTPENTLIGIVQELRLTAAEVQRGISVLYDCEVKLADAENAYDRELQLAFMNAQGTVADRTSVSRLQASNKRLAADLAKAEYNRVKAKLKALEMAQMSIQTQARLLETEIKTFRG